MQTVRRIRPASRPLAPGTGYETSEAPGFSGWPSRSRMTSINTNLIGPPPCHLAVNYKIQYLTFVTVSRRVVRVRN